MTRLLAPAAPSENDRSQLSLATEAARNLATTTKSVPQMQAIGPPTPDDLDDLLSRRRRSRYFLAHPAAIAAFHRECTRRGIEPGGTEVSGSRVAAWRGVMSYLVSAYYPVAGLVPDALEVLDNVELGRAA